MIRNFDIRNLVPVPYAAGCEWDMTEVTARSAERGARLAAILYGVQSAQAHWWADQLMSVQNSKNPPSWKDQLDSDEKCPELINFNKSFDLTCSRSPSLANQDRIKLS